MRAAGLLWRTRTGAPWSDPLERCGPWRTVAIREDKLASSDLAFVDLSAILIWL
jgi:transposase